MSNPATITPAIVDALYEDALDLAEEARALFEASDARKPREAHESDVRVAMSCEALRTTTRMMHAMAWLLNHRAFFAGEMSEFQLRRHGRLPPPQVEGDVDHRKLLDPHTRQVVDRTRAFYSRIERLDTAWRDQFEMQPAAVHRLRQRLGEAVTAF